MSANIGHNSGHNMRESHPHSMSSLMSRSQELNYVEALKTHQKTRLNHIRNETKKLKLYLETLKEDVMTLETKRQQHCTEGQDWMQKVSKLREDNRSLRIECHCLSMEVDLYARGEMPLGVTDETYYQNIPSLPLRPNTAPIPPIGRPYPVQPMPRQLQPTQPPTYEESIYYPPPRFALINNSCNNNILTQVPPAPRPVWLPSPSVQQSVQTISPLTVHNNSLQTPPLPPRPNSASPRIVPNSFPVGVQASAAAAEDGQRWVCEKCTVENHPALAYCELCEMPRNAFLGTANRT